ncbi:receptor-type tyrosine-protein phosphatase mu-like isoform X2 [Haliotis rubra]|uniref:receptor-type tyrosine-protein phosphatase mu-like isoform X2 n=1 Tax=Haliotis rubra TaxID=36100 RepID=UPI001EE502FB|nr:receptor-type tyrosine-protein phosphatase mu-like isoform X2 [Haliotis rubra]
MAWFLTGLLFFSITGTLAGAECHCSTAADCVVFPSTPCSQVGDPDRCQEGWFGSYCQRQNIALGRSATQSSTFSESSVRTGNTAHSFEAWYAVDGRATTDFYSKPLTCTHTLGGVQTWTVNLNNSNRDKIQHIRLYLRQNFQDRNNGMKIYVGGQLCIGWSWNTYPLAITDFKCQQALTGNNLQIQTRSFLTLCEVQIFVCSDSWFGEDCDKQCHCSLNTDVCDKITGQCLSGCAPGYMGTDCQTACPDGSYGISCASQCGNCLDGHVCNKSTGICPGGCAEGWMNDTCVHPCPNGYYGTNCGFQCGNCVDGDVCIKTNGTCPGGCAAGWINDTCHQACPDDYYGTDCTSKCGNCLDKDVCNKSTGLCPNGCAAGWMDNTCHNVCEDGRYGSGCMSECGHCRNGTVCDKTNGTCGSGCDGGYSDARCERLSVTDDKEDSMAGIIGGTVAALLAIAIVIIVVVIIFRRRKEPKHDNERLQSTKDMTNLKIRTEKATRKNPSSTPPTKDDEDEDATLGVETEVDVVNDASATYYNFVPPHMTLGTLQQCIIEKKTKATFPTEFQAIPYGARHPHTVGKQPENKKKNRFLALYAYDESRVVLADGEDYINANYIYGYDDTQKYIATQGPKPDTVTDFWRMVWQEDVTQIVMLTRLMELNKKKSAKYWPDATKTETYGNIRVNNKDITTRADYTISTFLVQCSGVEKTVTHCHFTSWPDHGVPSAPALVNFWRLVKQGDMGWGPMVVHCSAGVGRTGAFIALDYLMDEAEGDNRVNVYMCVGKMRLYRMNMVQTESQYEFVHDVVLEALHSRGTLYTLPDFDKTFGLGESFTTQQQAMLKKEFKLLRELSSNLTEEATSHALLPENSDKNRSLDILPGNNSRPYLCTPVQKRNDYINGVFLPTTLHLSSLIVTQTPLPDTVVDFWRLVYDHDCFTIVCLDDAQESTGMYPEENKVLKQGPFNVVQVEADSNREFYTEKELTLAHGKENSEKSISVFCLQSLDILTNTEALHELVSRVDRIISSADHKVLVHCHDGAGASGVFCSVLNIITRLKLDRTVDIFLTIRELQRVRPQFIQTFDQFKLCYNMVKEYNRASNVYANL